MNVSSDRSVPALSQAQNPIQGARTESPHLIQVPVDGNIPLFTFTDLLRRRRKLIFGVAAAFFTAALLYCLTAPRIYTATTTLEIRGYAPLLQQAEMENLLGRDTRRLEYTKTTIAKLSQYGIADKALLRNGLAEELQKYFVRKRGIIEKTRRWIGRHFRLLKPSTSTSFTPLPPAPGNLFRHAESALRSYLGLLDIEPIHETSLVTVSAETSDPKLSQKIVNTHAEVFIEHLRVQRQEELRQNIVALEQHANELKVKLADADAKVAAYAREHGLVAFAGSKDQNPFAKSITDLTELLAQATSKRIRSESLLNELQSRATGDASPADDKTIEALRLELQQVEAEYAALAEKVTPRYPTLVELGAKRSSLKNAIENERRGKLVALTAEYKSDLAAEQNLLQQVEKQKQIVNDSAIHLASYNVLVREADTVRQLADAVLKELQETRISMESSKSNIFVSDYAPLPKKPSAPMVNTILVMSLVLGLVAGVSSAIALDMLNNKITDGDDAQRTLGIAALGHVPSFNRPTRAASAGLLSVLPWKRSTTPATVPVSSRDLVTIRSPQAAVSEALRTIRAGILFSSASNPLQVLMVTSANKGDGKTTVSTNLSVTLAQAGHRTLLIDADLRHSTAANLLGADPNQPGLVDILVGHGIVNECIMPGAVEKLFVLPPGSKTPNPAELLGSPRMAELMKYLATAFDFVVIDTPPVLPVSDSLLLSRLTDGVIFVLRSQQTTRPQAREAQHRLKRLGANIVGAVINDLTADNQSYGNPGDYYYPPHVGNL